MKAGPLRSDFVVCMTILVQMWMCVWLSVAVCV